MPEPGHYQGKRLSATDVKRLYAAGECDFRGAVLRGGDFCRTDLSGADFSGADLRGARFTEATLRATKFCHGQAGLQRRIWIVQLALVAVMAILAGFWQGLSGAWLGHLSTTGYLEDAIAAILGVILIVATVLAIALQGFTNRALVAVAVIVTLAGATAGAFALAGDVTAVNVISGASAVAGSLAGAVAGSLAVAGAVIIAVTLAGAGAGAVTVVIAFVSALVLTTVIAGALTGMLAGAAAVGSVNFFLPVYILRQVSREAAKFENLRTVGLIFTSVGGTSFSGADLTEASFAQACLKTTNFADARQHPTVLTRVRWHHAHQLNYARLETSNLHDRHVRRLLTTLDGVDQTLIDADLRGANLAGAKLHRVNLREANLNGATLAGAELHGAILTEAQCVGTDFTTAHLTGACIEAWNIDDSTSLKDVDCQYVFLREEPDSRGSRERRPHDPDKDFQPGDFERIFKEMIDTIQILIRNGVDPEAFRTAFERVMAENPELSRNAIQGIEKQGNDVLLTLQVPAGTDKAKVERSWDEGYQLGLRAGYTSGLLEGQTQRADDVKEVALGFGKLLSSIQITNMNTPIHTGDGSFYAGGDVNLSGSTLNMGEISGQVTNQINQIREPINRNQPSLKDLLTQLKAATETDSELSDDEKAEALQAIARIAAAATAPAPTEKTQGIVKRATDTLEGMTETLTDASKLADACTKLLPFVLSLFALI